MSIKQVSIFLENKPGKVYDVIKLLGSNNIDIKALSIADTDKYGIMRLILNKPYYALNLLKDNNYIVKMNDVIAISIDNKPGGLMTALSLLYNENIGIEYMYAFVGDNNIKASVMLKVDDPVKALELFKKGNISILTMDMVHEKE